MNPVHERIEAHIPNMEGWCTVEKAKDIADLILQERPFMCVEIGVFAGRSLLAAAFALEANQHGGIYGIDPWQKQASLEGSNAPGNDDWWSKVDYEHFYKYTIDHIFNHGLSKICIPLRLTSSQANRLFNDQEIDILHIDGNHSEETSCADVRMWLPKVKNGGYVIFDDIDWPSTKKAVSILEKFCSVYFKKETYAFFKKKELTF